MEQAEVRKMWIAALRSGDYNQGYGTLRDTLGDYCCLGVLADLAVRHGIVGRFPDKDTLCEASESYSPDPIAQWAGLATGTGRIDPAGSLATMNDRRASFDTIADIIEDEFPGLFVAPTTP